MAPDQHTERPECQHQHRDEHPAEHQATVLPRASGMARSSSPARALAEEKHKVLPTSPRWGRSPASHRDLSSYNRESAATYCRQPVK